MTRKNVIGIVFQNSDRKSVPVQRTLKREMLQGLRPATMAPRLRWRCITRDQIYRYYRWIACAPPKGAGPAQGGRGAFNKTRNQSLEYDYTLKKIW